MSIASAELQRPPTPISRDLAMVEGIEVIPELLGVLCDLTGMGFAGVSRVAAGKWTACVVTDHIKFGLSPGTELDLDTTLCREAIDRMAPVIFGHAAKDPHYCNHPIPRAFGIESYVSVPIMLADGSCFGTLCAVDRKPADLSDARILSVFNRFARIIGRQIDIERAYELEHTALVNERATSELREQFIAILGHDLRNPLQAILATGDLLERKLSDPALAAFASRIRVNARRMSALIDDVLDFARGRLGGGLGVTLCEVDDLGGALDAVVGELRMAQPERVILTDIRIGARIRCDVVRIQQLASNLLANALTHGSASAPVRFSAHTGPGGFEIKVWNDGEPIPEASLGKIFAPFWRHSTADTRQGLGLGLHICSEIVRSHGGRLTVTSSREEGTEFIARFSLPIDR